MPQYTAPSNDAVDIEIDTSKAYTAPGNDAVHFATLPTTQIDDIDKVATDTLEVTWTKQDSNPNGGWELYRSGTAGTLGSLVASTTDATVTSFQDTVTDTTVRYFYTLRRYTDYTSADSTQLEAGFPTAASGATVDAITDTTLDVSWIDNETDEDGYRVKYSTDGGNSFTQHGSDLAANTTSYQLTGLRNGEEYVIDIDVFIGVVEV